MAFIHQDLVEDIPKRVLRSMKTLVNDYPGIPRYKLAADLSSMCYMDSETVLKLIDQAVTEFHIQDIKYQVKLEAAQQSMYFPIEYVVHLY